MIRTVAVSDLDRRALAQIKISPRDIKDDGFNYLHVAVKKPWGYEYLLSLKDDIAAWVLWIKSGCRTSMHCHLGKRTALIVLDGMVSFSTLSGSTQPRIGDVVIVDKGAFHQTKAICSSYVMEIETPSNKRDVVRLEDAYGRGQGYETEYLTQFKRFGELNNGVLDGVEEAISRLLEK